LQISTVLTVTEDNKETVIAVLERLSAVGAISRYELKDILEQIEQYGK
jgi:hypothetical protein